MNRIFRTLWSSSRQCWQAVPEHTKAAGKGSSKTSSCSHSSGGVASVILGFMFTGSVGAQSPPSAKVLPTGGVVAQGVASISQTATANAAAMTVNQTSQRAVINWNTFHLGSAASVNFAQPNAQAVTLNRVSDANPSQIYGRISAPGQVFLSNPSGVYFSPSAQVDVGALTATTHSISDANFMAGKYRFERDGATGKVVNEGKLSAALGGYIALLAPEVQNAGVVVAQAGTVAMAAGELITLNLNGVGGLASLTTTPSTIASLVENKHAVLAPDGQIVLSAVALNKLHSGVVKNSGSLEANSLVNKGGKIVLEGDDITLDRNSKIEAKGPTGGGIVLVGGDWQGSGDLRQATKLTMEAGATIDASATDKGDGGKVVLWSDVHNADSVTRASGSIKAEAGPNGGDGGKVETSGYELSVDGIQVSTQSTKGSAGEWLLDPFDINIVANGVGASGTPFASNYTALASSRILASAVNTALANGNVTIMTDGYVYVSAPISWTTSNTLKLSGSNISDSSAAGYQAISMGTGASLIFEASSNALNGYGGVISGGGSFIKQGAGYARLFGVNTYTGGTTVSQGTLLISSGSALSNGAISVASGGVLDLSGYTLNNTGGLTLNGTGIGGGGALINSSTMSPGTVTGLVTLGSDTTISGGTKGLLLSNAGTITGAFNLTLDGAATVSSIVSIIGTGTGNLVKEGVGTWTLSGANTYSGTTNVSAGTLQIGNGGTSGSLGTGGVTNNATLRFNRSNGLTVSNAISGTGTLIQAGSGTTTLTGANSYSATTISAGTLQIGNGGTSGSLGTGAVTDNAALRFNRSDSIAISNAISGTGSLIQAGTGTVILTGTNSYGATTISAGTLQIGDGVTSGSLGGSVTNNATLYLKPFASFTLSNVISGTGGIKVESNVGYAVTLSGANTYTGPTDLLKGVLRTGVASVTNADGVFVSGPFGINSAVTIQNAASTSLSLLHSAQIGSLSGGGVLNNGSVNLYGNTLTIGGDNTNSTFDGVITDNWVAINPGTSPRGVLRKVGTGTLTLTGTNTYDGLTSITAGTLRAASNKALGEVSGGVTVANGATLEIGGTTAPGNVAIGAEALTIASGGTVHNVAGANTYAGALTFTAPNAPAQGIYTITIDTGTSLNFTATGGSQVVPANSVLNLNLTSGNLTFGKALSGTTGSSTYVKVGSGTLTMPAPTGMTLKTGIFARLRDPTGNDFSSVYGDTPDYTFGFYDSATGGNLVNVLPANYTLGTLAWTGTQPVAGSATGNYSLTYASGLTVTSPSYVLMPGGGATTWTVAPKPVTVSLARPDFTYNGATTYASLAAGATITTNTPLVGGDAIDSVVRAATLVGGGAANGVAQGGSYMVTPSNAAMRVGNANNYIFSYSPVTGTVLKAPLTMTANDASKLLGQADPAFSARYVGFVNGETEAVLTSPTVTRTDAGAPNTSAQTYPGLLQPSATSDNYAITPVNGAFTIVPADTLLIKVANVNKTYGTAPTYTVTSAQYLKSGDLIPLKNVTVTSAGGGHFTFTDGLAPTPTTGSFDLVSSATANSDVSNYAITVANFTKTGNNFSVATPVVQAGNLAVVPLTATLAPTLTVSKQYDGSTAATGVVAITNKVGSDDVSVSGIGNYTDNAHAGTTHTYTIAGLSLNGAKASNYLVDLANLPPLTGNNGVITPAPLTVTTSNVVKTYDGTLSVVGAATAPALTVTSGTLYANASNGGATDSLSGGTFAFTNANAGAGNKTVTVSNATVTDGNGGGNYAITYVNNTTSTINTATPTLTGLSNQTKTVGAANFTLEANSNSVGAVTYTSSDPTVATVNAATGEVTVVGAGNATITATQAANGNYALGNATYTLTVSAAPPSAPPPAPPAPPPNPALTDADILALTPLQVTALTSNQLGLLTTAQMALFNAPQFAAMTASQIAILTQAQIAGLTASQIQTLSVSQLAGLTPTQLGGLSNSQLSSLSLQQAVSLTAAQLAGLTPAQLAILIKSAPPPVIVPPVVPPPVAAPAVVNLPKPVLTLPAPIVVAEPVSTNTPEMPTVASPAASLDLTEMTTRQVALIPVQQVRQLSSAQIESMSGIQVRTLSPQQLGVMSSGQVAAFRPPQLQVMTTTQVASFAPAQLVDLQPHQIASFTLTQLKAMTPAQAQSLTTMQLSALNVAQRAAVAVDTITIPVPATTLATATQSTGVLPITVLDGGSASRATTAGVAFAQGPDSITLRSVDTPPAVNSPRADLLAFNDKLTTFMVTSNVGELVEFQGSLIGNRLMIIAPTNSARQVARAEMKLVLAAAITTLGREQRVMLADLQGVVFDLR